ncbi:hypothetical protein [Piscirickettsia salmonis]|uniref:hypothetical protein n=1 Tax=Piscirickettsia salmonis TaxID=1238 RepID=UPI0007C9058D|nr:hypothetical protein A0O36_00684 [Piscirickettsiaceae bacterium NZ-RLO1]
MALNDEQSKLLGRLFAQASQSQSAEDLVSILNDLQKSQAFKGYFSDPRNHHFDIEFQSCQTMCMKIQLLEAQRILEETTKKQQQLSDIETIIVNQAQGYGFDLGFGGSRHRIQISVRESLQVPEPIAKIMQLIKDNRLNSSEKITEIKKIQSSAIRGHRSGFLFFARTQHSTNQFISRLDCG